MGWAGGVGRARCGAAFSIVSGVCARWNCTRNRPQEVIQPDAKPKPNPRPNAKLPSRLLPKVEGDHARELGRALSALTAEFTTSPKEDMEVADKVPLLPYVCLCPLWRIHHTHTHPFLRP